MINLSVFQDSGAGHRGLTGSAPLDAQASLEPATWWALRKRGTPHAHPHGHLGDGPSVSVSCVPAAA